MSTTITTPSTAPTSPVGVAGRRVVRGLVLLVALAVIAVVACLDLVRVEGISMRPTLVQGDRLVVQTRGPGAADWGIGDLVAVRGEVEGRTQLLVKRVVAVGGQSVGIADGALVVDGHQVREPYTRPGAIDSVYFGPVSVPEGFVFVLGDNRAESVDSRDFGPVPLDHVEGRVRDIWWPLGRLGKDLS